LTASVESTQTLLNRLHGGDRQAVETLLERSVGPLQRWARGRLPAWARDLLETDDLVQETVLRTLGRLDRFEAERSGAFLAYLRTAVANRIRDEMRRVGRKPLRAETFGHLADPAPSPVETVLGKESFRRLERALDRLADDDRELVVARVELRCSYRQIADMLGKPSEDAARMAVRRAVLRLAEEMAHDE